MAWYSRMCPHCGGDLYDSDDDPGWVVCLQCAREFEKGNNRSKTVIITNDEKVEEIGEEG